MAVLTVPRLWDSVPEISGLFTDIPGTDFWTT